MRALLLSVLLLCSCTTPPAPQPVVIDAPVAPAASVTPPVVRQDPLPLCCDSFEQIKQLDGTRVILEGVYKPVILSKRPARDPMPEPPPGKPALVSIDPPSQYQVMLGVYHSASGPRPAEEVDRLRGKKVRVTGTLHAFTPSQTDPSGAVMQTMIGPYIEPESIDPLP